MGFTVSGIDKKGAAYCAGLRKGDVVTGFNGEPFLDYIDYIRFSSAEEIVVRYVSREQARETVVRKRAEEPLGLEFAENLLGGTRTCRNRCIFCFVDQLPKGMRKSLYEKDEDWRLSFIMGNYVTLSGIREEELARIVRRGASPLYVSVHAADEDLRKKLLNNPRARPIRETLQRLADGGISFHAQAVVCPGLNDGAALTETMAYLFSLYPRARSLAVVPVGLTAHRQGLYPLKPMDRDSARQTLEAVHAFAKQALRQSGTRFAFASDEVYIRAGRPLPPAEAYEDYAQIENGVGMLRRFESEINAALRDHAGARPRFKSVSVATGTDAYPYVRGLFESIAAQFNMEIDVIPISNAFFGQGVTVSGLLTGADLYRTLKERSLGEALLVPANMFREGEDVFLDDMRAGQLQSLLGAKVVIVPADGYAAVEALVRPDRATLRRAWTRPKRESE